MPRTIYGLPPIRGFHEELYQPPVPLTAGVLLTHLQYLHTTATPDTDPLDLSLKTGVRQVENNPITPPTTPSPSLEIKRRRSDTSPENLHVTSENHHPPLPPPGVTKRVKATCTIIPSVVTPPSRPTAASPVKKSKAVRKLNFDEDKTSPVSGTIIRELGPDETLVVRKGDIDPAYNVVEVTEEAKAELAKIENHIGDYVCRLCRQLYEDAFRLAQHRCSRIVHVEYRCPECDKVFNCPANLASHRRWHKPRAVKETTTSVATSSASTAGVDDAALQFPCIECGKKFRRQAYLRKHLSTHIGGGCATEGGSATTTDDDEVN